MIDQFRWAPWATEERSWRWAIVLLFLSIGLLAHDITAHTSAGVTDAAGEHLGRDFVNYWSGARLAMNGQSRLAYDIGYFNGFEKSLVGSASEFKLYSYPPIAMILTLPFAGVGFLAGLALWTGAGIVLCVLPLSRLIGWRLAVCGSIGAPAAFLDLITGQNGHFTAALLAIGLTIINRRAILAGICLGLLAYKPHLGLLLPVALVAGGHWRTIAAAAATVVTLLVVSTLLLGFDTWVGFLGQMALQKQLMEQMTPFWHRTQSVFLALRMAGTGLSVAYAGQALSLVLTVTAVAATWRSKGTIELKAAVLVVAMILATPYAWDYDLVAVIFAVAWLVDQASRTGFLAWEKTAMVVLLGQPFLTFVLTEATGIQVAPLLLGFGLAVLVRRALIEGVDAKHAAAPRLVEA